MLLGKRPRQPIKRTTSMSGFAFDPPSSTPSAVDFAVASSDPGAVAVLPDQRTVPSALTALVSPRVMQRRFSADFDGHHVSASHFLSSCSFCERRFVPGRDLYMYRGDMAFCSLECRQHQMKKDEKKERTSASAKKAPAVKEKPSTLAAV